MQLTSRIQIVPNHAVSREPTPTHQNINATTYSTIHGLSIRKRKIGYKKVRKENEE